jgi:hypothetical protein
VPTPRPLRPIVPFPAVLLAFVAAGLGSAPVPSRAADRCLVPDKVRTWDFLNIRAEPDAGARIVAAAAPSSGSVMLQTGPCVPAKEPRPTRRWCPVRYAPVDGVLRSGYVKAYFTRSVDCPPAVLDRLKAPPG